MGFLDNMVRGLISESTGYDTRKMSRLVRRIGGSKLLLAGGAAVAGAMAVQHFSKKDSPQGVASQASGGTPPPPPSGGPVPPDLPPLPSLPTSGEAERAEVAAGPRDLLALVIRAMVAAALADGELSADERSVLEGHLEESELTPEQTERVRKDMVLPPTPGELAEAVEDLPEAEAAEARDTLYRAAALVVHADREVAAAELDWLARLGAELGLSEERAEELQAEVFGDEV